MENKVKIIFLFSLLFVFSTGSAQTIDQLEKLVELQATAEDMTDSDISKPKEEKITEIKELGVLREEQQLILDLGADFGFSGRSDFCIRLHSLRTDIRSRTRGLCPT